MQHRLTSQSQLPPKQKFASTFGFLGQISYWVHLLLGFASGITLLLVFFSRSFSEQSNNPAIAIVLIFSVAALLVLGFRIYWILGLELYSFSLKFTGRKSSLTS